MIKPDDIVDIQLDDVVQDSLSATESFISDRIQPAGERLLNLALENKKTSTELASAASLAYGAQKVIDNLPKGGVGQMYADHSMNFLEGFYAKNAPKKTLYAQEFKKATERLGRLFVDPKGIIAYKGTGVSKLTDDFIKTLDADLLNVDERYVAGEFGNGKTAIEKAARAKKKHLKQRHYKVLNDAANRTIFSGKNSRILNKYRLNNGKPWWTSSDGKEFLKIAGSKTKAQYMMKVHTIGHQNIPFYGKFHQKMFGDKRLDFGPNTEFIKWSDNYVSGITHGAQFNPKTYFALEDIKNNPKIKTITDAMVHLDDVHGIKTTKLGNNRLLFNFSPTIKSNFDWGGYNAVAEWSIKDRGRVTFTGTDLRDTPISSMFKGKNVLNYVEAKNVNISDLKEEAEIFDDEPQAKKSNRGRKKGGFNEPKPGAQTKRINDVREGLTSPKGSLYRNIDTNLKDITTSMDRYKSGITAQKAYSKAMGKFGKSRGALAAGAILALASQFTDNNKKVKEEEDRLYNDD